MVIQVSKMEAAKFQLREAINLFFERRDPVSVHTLARAASEIFHDYLKHRGLPVILHAESLLIKEEDRVTWRAKLVEAKNFFKHADKNLKSGKETILFNTDTNDFFIAEAIHSLRALEAPGIMFAEFMVFSLWFNKRYPESLADQIFAEELKEVDFIDCDDYSGFIDLINMIKENPGSP